MACARGAWIWAASRDDTAKTCEASRIDELWTPQTRATAAAAFEQAQPYYGSQTWWKLAYDVDAYVDRWSDAFEDACIARGDVLDHRMECLHDELDQLAGLLGVFETADEAVVRGGAGLVALLEAPENCLRASERKLWMPEAPQQAALARTIHGRMQRVLLLERAGRYDAGLRLAEAVLRDAEAVDNPLLVAHTRYALGSVLDRKARYDEAREHYEAAAFEFRAAGDDASLLEVARSLTFLLAFRLGQSEAAEQWLREGEAMVDRLERDDAREHAAREARFMQTKATLLDTRGDYEGSRDALRAALAHADRETDFATSVIHLNLGAAEMRLGNYDTARVHAKRAHDLHVAELGADHPETLNALENLALVRLRLGDESGAEAAIETALRKRREQLGPDHPDVSRSYNHLGSVFDAQGRYELAIVQYRKAAEAMEKVAGEDHPNAVAARINLALALVRTKEGHEEARSLLESAVDALRAVLPETHEFFVFAWSGLARAHLALGDEDAALSRAEAASSRCAGGEGEAATCAFAQMSHALVLERLGRDAEARARAEAARARLDAAKVGDTADRREVERWLANE